MNQKIPQWPGWDPDPDPTDDTETELIPATDPDTGGESDGPTDLDTEGDTVPDGDSGEDGGGPKPRKKLLWIAALCAAAALLLLLIWHPWSRGLQFSDVPACALSAGGAHTVGLRSDGTAVAVGWNEDNQCDVSEWKLKTTD